MARERRHERPRSRGKAEVKSREPVTKSASFVMALWVEPGSPREAPEWRWRLIQVQSGERRYFRRLSDVLAYVSEQAGMAPPE